MGFIPETVTRRLPSAVVGTLGVDTSGEQLGIAVARAGEKVFGAVAQKAAERKRTLDIISAQAMIRQFESEMDGATTGIKGTFKNEPQGGVEQTFNAGEQLIEATLGDTKNANVRAMAAQGMTSSLRRSGNQMKSWAHQQEVINGARDYSQVTNFNAEQLSKKPDVDLMEQMIAFELGREDLAKGLYGKSWPQAVKQSVQATYKAQIRGLESTDPATGVRFLEEYDFKGAFSPDEMKTLKKQMRDSFEGRVKTEEFESNISTLNLFSGADKAIRESKNPVGVVDDLELALDAQGLLTPEAEVEVAKLRKIAAKATSLTTIESTERVLKLYNELDNMQLSVDKKTANATLQEIYNYRSNVVQADGDGVLAPGRKEWFLKQIEVIRTDELELATGKKEQSLIKGVLFGAGNIFSLFSSPATPEQHGFRKVNAWLKEANFSESVGAKAKVKILGDLMEEITDLRRQGVSITNEMVEELAETHFKEEMVRQLPALQRIPDEGVAKRLTNGKKVLIFKNGIIIPLK